MSSSPDPFQSYFDSHEPKQELDSPFLTEALFVDEEREATSAWETRLNRFQLESPFLDAFEEGWGAIGESEAKEYDELLDELGEETLEEEFEAEVFDEYKSNEKDFFTNEGLEELQDSEPKLQIKEVIYVHGKYNPQKLDLNPWKWAHPRNSRSNTALNLFDYDLGKHKKWDNWNGTLPPTQAPNSESAITSILDLYAFIKVLPSGSVEELHFFTHGWRGGPVLFNTYDSEVDPNKRDPNDQDPRIKDFNDPSVLGGAEGQKFKAAFYKSELKSALVKLWGCTYEQDYRDRIQVFFKKNTKEKQRGKIIKDFQATISQTYQFVLHHAIDIPVYAAPLGYGTDPSLPVGIEGKKGRELATKNKVKYKGIWPPKKGDQWWKVSPFFGPERARDFYKKILGAELDILDYVAYTKDLVDPALQKNVIVKELSTHEEEVLETQEFDKVFNQLDEEEIDEQKANILLFNDEAEPETEVFHKLLDQLAEEELEEELVSEKLGWGRTTDLIDKDHFPYIDQMLIETSNFQNYFIKCYKTTKIRFSKVAEIVDKQVFDAIYQKIHDKLPNDDIWGVTDKMKPRIYIRSINQHLQTQIGTAVHEAVHLFQYPLISKAGTTHFYTLYGRISEGMTECVSESILRGQKFNKVRSGAYSVEREVVERLIRVVGLKSVADDYFIGTKRIWQELEQMYAFGEFKSLLFEADKTRNYKQVKSFLSKL